MSLVSRIVVERHPSPVTVRQLADRLDTDRGAAARLAARAARRGLVESTEYRADGSGVAFKVFHLARSESGAGSDREEIHG